MDRADFLQMSAFVVILSHQLKQTGYITLEGLSSKLGILEEETRRLVEENIELTFIGQDKGGGYKLLDSGKNKLILLIQEYQL